MIRRAFESIRTAGEGDPDCRSLASFCSSRNRGFEYGLRPDTLQKLLDEADAQAPDPKPKASEPTGPVFVGERRFV
jgi:hypothetical protein